MFENVRADLRGYTLQSAAKESMPFRMILHACIFSYGWHAMIGYRLGRYVNSLGNHSFSLHSKRILQFGYRILEYVLWRMYDIRISSEADIGKGFYIGHFGGIRIGKCKIGENCSIHQQVVIGPGRDDAEGWALIGNNVWIGAHSKIEGSIKIGNDVTIAAGSIVMNDIKDGALVMGNPARVIKRFYDNSSLLRQPKVRPL